MTPLEIDASIVAMSQAVCLEIGDAIKAEPSSVAALVEVLWRKTVLPICKRAHNRACRGQTALLVLVSFLEECRYAFRPMRGRNITADEGFSGLLATPGPLAISSDDVAKVQYVVGVACDRTVLLVESMLSGYHGFDMARNRWQKIIADHDAWRDRHPHWKLFQ